MFSIITRIEVTPSQTLGTCPEVRPGGGQSWGGGRGASRARPRRCGALTEPAPP